VKSSAKENSAEPCTWLRICPFHGKLSSKKSICTVTEGMYEHRTPGVFQKEAIGQMSFLNLRFMESVVQKGT